MKKRKIVANGKPVWQLEYQHREPKAKKCTNASISMDDSWTSPQIDRIVPADHILFERMPVLAGGVALHRIVRDLVQLIVGLDSEHPRVPPWISFEIMQSRGKKKYTDARVCLAQRSYYVNLNTKKLEVLRLTLEPATIAEFNVPDLPPNHVFARNTQAENTKRYAESHKQKEALLDGKSQKSKDLKVAVEDSDISEEDTGIST